MEIIIFGNGIKVAAGMTPDCEDISEYGLTEILSVQVIDDEGNEIFASQVETFKTYRTYDLDFNSLPYVTVYCMTMQYSWKDINEWNPDELVFYKSMYNTPAGDIEIVNCSYKGASEDIITPCRLDDIKHGW